MQSAVLFAVICIFLGVKSQVSNTIPTTVSQSTQSTQQETSPQQALKEAIKTKKDKYSCVLNLLKSALAEELKNSKCQITEEATQDSVLSSLNSILEEEQITKVNEEELEKGLINLNETDAEKAVYQNIVTKIASTVLKPKNNTNNQSNVEMPSLIPIFKPQPVPARNELCQKLVDSNPPPCNSARQSPNPRAITFVPEKIIQTNVNLIPNQPKFKIPCQKAADVLDMTNIAVPKEICCNERPKMYPIVQETKPNLPNDVTPVTLSVNCADSDDTVAMLFKPKAISLMQLYGNLLKKITITVLVPYHMSKLAEK